MKEKKTKYSKKYLKKMRKIRKRILHYAIGAWVFFAFTLFIASFALVSIFKANANITPLHSTLGITDENKCLGARAVFNFQECPESPYGQKSEKDQAEEDALPWGKKEISPGLGLYASENIFTSGNDEEFTKLWRNVHSGLNANQFGDKDATKSIAVLGNSHSGMYMDAFDIIGKERGYKVQNVWASALNYHQPTSFLDSGPMCAAQQDFRVGLFRVTEKMFEYYKWIAQNSDIIVISSYLDDFNQQNCTVISPVLAVKILNSLGVKPLILQDMYTDEEVFKKCTVERTPENCSTPKEEALKTMNRLPDELNKAHLENGYTLVETDDFFCNEERCFYDVGKLAISYDYLHFTGKFSASLAPILASRLEAKLGYIL